MKANEYLKKIQRLNSEAEKVMRQISVLSEIAEKISCDSLADMLDDIIEDIYETHSSLTEKVSLMIATSQILMNPLKVRCLFTISTVAIAGVRLRKNFISQKSTCR